MAKPRSASRWSGPVAQSERPRPAGAVLTSPPNDLSQEAGPQPSAPGVLVSVEGINGVGKTYLTTLIVERLAATDQRPLVLEEYSRRLHDAPVDLGRSIVRALAAEGDYFLRSGRPRSETLLLLAVKMHDYEATRPALDAGQLVIEGRSLYSTAVYQAAILHPHDDAAADAEARTILDLATRWRPVPDLTILLTDDHHAALARAEHRDGRPLTDEQRHLHARVGATFERLASTGAYPIESIDRRRVGTSDIVEQAVSAITTALRAARLP